MGNFVTKKEKRGFVRFEIPGAKVSYFQKFLFFSSILYSEEFCPVIDISRGGIKFGSRRSHKSHKKVLMKMYFPDEKSCLNLKGRVRWSLFNPFDDYDYNVGIQFAPFGGRKGYNQSLALEKLISLEKKSMTIDSSSSGSSTLD